MCARQVETIRTANLRLVPLTPRFVHAEVDGDPGLAAGEVGARVGAWPTSDPSHIVQLHLAAQAAEVAGYPGLGRAIVLDVPDRPRSLIGSIGFHGPPDEHGQLEASCRIHPAYVGRGYASEALGAMLDWARLQYGVTRFVVAVSPHAAGEEPAPLDIAAPNEVPLDDLETMPGASAPAPVGD